MIESVSVEIDMVGIEIKTLQEIKDRIAKAITEEFKLQDIGIVIKEYKGHNTWD